MLCIVCLRRLLFPFPQRLLPKSPQLFTCLPISALPTSLPCLLLHWETEMSLTCFMTHENPSTLSPLLSCIFSSGKCLFPGLISTWVLNASLFRDLQSLALLVTLRQLSASVFIFLLVLFPLYSLKWNSQDPATARHCPTFHSLTHKPLASNSSPFISKVLAKDLHRLPCDTKCFFLVHLRSFKYRI